jgi:hypothetical protein
MSDELGSKDSIIKDGRLPASLYAEEYPLKIRVFFSNSGLIIFILIIKIILLPGNYSLDKIYFITNCGIV